MVYTERVVGQVVVLHDTFSMASPSVLYLNLPKQASHKETLISLVDKKFAEGEVIALSLCVVCWATYCEDFEVGAVGLLFCKTPSRDV